MAGKSLIQSGWKKGDLTDDIAYFHKLQQEVEAALEAYLPAADAYPQRIREAMRYSVLGGGKRLRPLLVLMACQTTGGLERRAMPAACAVEMLHTYTLIHDDLPCMDDDDLRRGRPTCHKAFDEATAVLAGDALLTHAFLLLAQELPRQGVSPETTVAVIQELAAAGGVDGVIGGQMADLDAEGRQVTLDQLGYIHLHKTAVLIQACVRIGGLLSKAGEAEMKALTSFGEKLGLAFQIQDDILDVTGNEAALGKRTGKDEHLGKATYPALIGLEQAVKEGEAATQRALEALDPLGSNARRLRRMALYLLKRSH